MSLLWRTAVEAGVEMMPLHEMHHLHSGDYCVPMHEVPERMDEDWADHEDYGDQVRSNWMEHGGPGGYVSHLAEGIKSRGGKMDPIHILHAPPESHGHGDCGEAHTWVDDGHHRYLAAPVAGLREVPVQHHYGRWDPERKMTVFGDIGVES